MKYHRWHTKRVTCQNEHACMRERERERENLEEKLKGNELRILLFDKEGENASLPQLVKHHNTKQGSPKCQKQHQPIWLPWWWWWWSAAIVICLVMMRSTHGQYLFLSQKWKKEIGLSLLPSLFSFLNLIYVAFASERFKWEWGPLLACHAKRTMQLLAYSHSQEVFIKVKKHGNCFLALILETHWQIV